MNDAVTAIGWCLAIIGWCGLMILLNARRTWEIRETELTYRVAELEERLCPTEQHDWVLVGSRYSYQTMDNVNRYKCRRCGKEKEVWD